MDPEKASLAVPARFRRDAHRTRERWLESGVFAIDLLRRTLAPRDLADSEVLDVGCGTKIAKTLLDNSVAIGRYAGVDAAAPVVEWLTENISDPRFEFHHLDAYNEMYNPGGRGLGSFERLPVGAGSFDLICLFSVFTHLAPDDYVAMLRLLRRHARADTKLLFSLYVDDPEHPAPYEQVVAEGLERALASDDPETREQVQAAIGKAKAHREAQKGARFVDEIPDQPLAVARYTKDYALELVGSTGWEVEALHPPERFIQHYMICVPA